VALLQAQQLFPGGGNGSQSAISTEVNLYSFDFPEH
jgi:hypothetical protein